MANRNMVIERRQCRAQNRCRVALYQDQVRLFVGEIRVNGCNRTGGDLSQRLLRAHQIQVGVRLDVEDLQYLVEHLAVLCRDADMAFKIRLPLQGQDDRGQFDGLRSRAENDRDFQKQLPDALFASR